MKQRIYWLLPDLASARRTMQDLLQARVAAAHIHFAGPPDMDERGLHAASVLQTSDLVHAAKAGLLLGVGVGGIAGLLCALLYPVSGEAPQWELAATLALLGALIGAWSSSMVGISIPSPRLRRFASAIERGQILLMIDLPRARLREVQALLRRTHPEARFEGEEPLAPARP